jgi:phenolic acid decarboxylase
MSENVLLGKTVHYRYASGRVIEARYEAQRVTYTLRNGPFPDRTTVVREPHYARVAPNTWMTAWYEDGGATVTAVLNLDERVVTGFYTVPRWLIDNAPTLAADLSTVDAREAEMRATGIDWPRLVHFETAEILSIEPSAVPAS